MDSLGEKSSRRSRYFLEGIALVVSPMVAFFVLRLRAMAPTVLPDPSISSTYIFDPRDFFYRYSAVLSSTARMREGARVGFLVPARLAYLAFGAVPGFYVLRYVLVLIAVVPAYLLLKRLYGRGAGVLAVAVVLSSPVLVTAWGTDFPDSAVVSYMIGAIACLLMPIANRRIGAGWLAGAAFLFTMAVWSLATSVALVAVVLTAWFIVRLLRHRQNLWADIGLLAASAIVTTVALCVMSGVLLGQFNYLTPTIRSLIYLDTPAQEKLWHSANWRWAYYQAYVLVPPALAIAWIAFGRRWRNLSSVQLFIVLMTGLEVLVSYGLQFVGSVQLIEEHYFYATVWSSLCLSLIFLLAELTRPLAKYRCWSYLPAALVLGVALAYEAYRYVPRLDWLPVALPLALALVAIAVLCTFAVRKDGSWVTVSSVIAVVAIAEITLVLTVAPGGRHGLLAKAVYDPPTAYNKALGGSASNLIANYRFISEIHAFTGNATYRGEQLLTCVTAYNEETIDAIGQFHAGVNKLPGWCQNMTNSDIKDIESRHAAQILAISVHPMDVGHVLASLGPLHPMLARDTVLRSGRYVMRLWLINIPRYLKRASTGSAFTTGS